ncbi:MAG TPA: hypothetical protein VK574_16355 [Terracidiphilus sp.]|nr:hypothetical protein [Terracidiphilus sp.]
MASERDEVLKQVVEPPTQPTKLDEAISAGTTEAERITRQQLAQKHEMDRLKAELGWFGILFGTENHASLVIGFVVVFCGMLGAGGLWCLAYKTGSREFWSGEAHFALGAATTALGYIFGRGSKDGNSK